MTEHPGEKPNGSDFNRPHCPACSGLSRTGGFIRCDYHAAPINRTVVFGNAHTGDFLTVDENVTAYSNSRAKRLLLDDHLYKRNTKKQMGARALTIKTCYMRVPCHISIRYFTRTMIYIIAIY
jgi:hypothetical protein